MRVVLLVNLDQEPKIRFVFQAKVNGWLELKNFGFISSQTQLGLIARNISF